MSTTKRPPKKLRAGDVGVPVESKLRWSLLEAAAMVNLSEGVVRDLEDRGEFPRRVVVPNRDDGGKMQFIAAEVRAWGDGRDWRAMVAARTATKVGG